jgi:predicted nucleic acid-binding protein
VSSTFVDTSAIYALLDVSDERHADARATWAELAARRERLVSSNYVLVETMALVGRRLGMDAARALEGQLVPLLSLVWVDESLHRRATAALLVAGMRDLSLVDCTSFEIMRQRGLDRAFAFDAHYRQQGFDLVRSIG